MKDIDAFFEMISAAAERMFHSHGEVTPLFYLWMNEPRDGLTVLPANWQNDREKFIMCATARVALDTGFARYVGLTQEMWFAESVLKDGETVDVAKMTPPSQRPDRREGIMIFAIDGKNRKIGHREILRPKDQPATLGTVQCEASFEFTGISDGFAVLLGPEPMTAN